MGGAKIIYDPIGSVKCSLCICSKNPWEGFKQGSNIIQFIF